MGHIITWQDGTTDGMGDRVVFATEAEAQDAIANLGWQERAVVVEVPDAPDTDGAGRVLSTLSKAYKQGRSDGAEQFREALDEQRNEEAGSREDAASLVASWFSPGQVKADEGLINALSPGPLAAELGVSEQDVEDGSAEYRRALDEYNAGFEAGARAVASGEAR